MDTKLVSPSRTGMKRVPSTSGESADKAPLRAAQKRAGRKYPLFLAAILAFAAPGDLAAQSGGLVTRADPVTVWDFTGNPAAQAFSGDAFSFAFRQNIDLTNPDIGTADLAENLDLSIGLGGLRFENSHGQDNRSNQLSFALGSGAFGAGLGVSWAGQTSLYGPDSRYDLGILYRPFNILSIGITLEDAFSSDPRFGAGLAIRPFAPWSHPESTLTLSADAQVLDGKPSLQNAAARLMLQSWLGLKAWIEPEPRRFGLLASLRIGVVESQLVLPDARAADQLAFSSALRLDLPGRRTPYPFGKSLLVLDDMGPIAAMPALLNMPGFQDEPWLGSLIEAIDRGAKDPRVAGIVMYEPPVPRSAADGQALFRSLAGFKATGKPIYVYASHLGREDYVYVSAIADHLALNPNGQLGLADLGSFDLYFRGFFERLGIRLYSLQSHDTKTAYNTFTEYTITDAERRMKERYIGGLATQAYNAVQKARGSRLSGDAAELIANGPYLIPAQAEKAGLIDSLKYRDQFDKMVTELTGRAGRLDIRDYIVTTTDSWGPPAGSKTVPVIHLNGNIIPGEGVAGKSIGESSAQLIAALREDHSVAGIVLRVDSGGGSAFTSDLIAREVTLTIDAGKPVFVSMGGVAASGGYYLAAPATRIYVEEGTLTGSIGVTGIWPDLSGLLDKLSIGSASVSAGDSADFGNLFQPRREADAAALSASISHIYERFVAVVARGRSIETSRVDELGRGQVWLGSEAVGLGLVDEIGDLDSAKAGIARELGGPVRFIELLPGQRPAHALGSLLNSASSYLEGTALGTLPASSLISSLGTLEIPDLARRALDLAAEIEELGVGPQLLFPEYLFREQPGR